MYAVAVESLSKSYNNIHALQRLTLNVKEASMYGLIGPDGAGKTTFMRISTCLLLQTSGSVTVGGFETRKKPSHVKRLIGYMPQRFSLYQDLSVRENLIFFADLFGITKKERLNRIDELLSFSRLGLFLNRRAGKLSGGMKQKLALSCTLIHKPEVLFLDEPTTGVDPVSRREFWDILADLKRGGTTIIVSTPYMDEAERCDRVGLIFNGSLFAEDTPDKFPEYFKNELIAVRSPEIVRLARKLDFPDVVLDVRTFGDRVHLTVSNALGAVPVIEQFLKSNSIQNAIIERVNPSIEDVFVGHMKNE